MLLLRRGGLPLRLRLLRPERCLLEGERERERLRFDRGEERERDEGDLERDRRLPREGDLEWDRREDRPFLSTCCLLPSPSASGEGDLL